MVIDMRRQSSSSSSSFSSSIRCFPVIACLVFLSLGGINAEPPPKEAPPPRTYIIGLSPFLNKSVKDDIYRSIVRLVVQDLPLNSTLHLYDALELKTISQIKIPDARVFDSPKTRANQFAPAIHDLKLFLAEDHPKPTAPHLNFDSAVRLPQFLDFLSDNLQISNSSRALLLIGSPLYHDAKEPAFSMVDGYFPSDGHLQANREQSIFGYTAVSKSTQPLLVHWIYFGDPWLNDLHKEKITRFWTLYLERRGAQLASFAADLSTVCQAFTRPSTEEEHSRKRWTIDAAQKRIEMLRISRNVEVADWLTGTSLSDTAQTPPSSLNGPMKIGIRWKANIDLDLYATPVHGAETLFFQHVRSPEGYYFKDHRSSPGKEFEFIEFESPVDARQVEAFVNFYKGYCPSGPQGEVRIEFDGKI